MACYAKDVVATAVSEIGYRETGTNHTKYAEYIDKNYPDFYNGKKSWEGGGAQWCDILVDYCVLVNSSSAEEAEYVLCQPRKSAGAGCKESYGYYKKAGRTGKEPRIGAQIFFGTDEPKHTGLVVDLQGDSVVTVEGNSDNMTKRHTYKKTSSKIYGYGYPRYNEESKEDPKESTGDTSSPTTYTVHTNTGNPLRLRKEPNTHSDKLARIGNGKTIVAEGEVQGENIGGVTEWVKTTWEGKTGYCSKKYLR
jgi:hypothetical protein